MGSRSRNTSAKPSTPPSCKSLRNPARTHKVYEAETQRDREGDREGDTDREAERETHTLAFELTHASLRGVDPVAAARLCHKIWMGQVECGMAHVEVAEQDDLLQHTT